MRRLSGLAAVAASLMLFAFQAYGQQALHRVAVLASTEVPELTQAFLEEFREHGYVVGHNLQIDFRLL